MCGRSLRCSSVATGGSVRKREAGTSGPRLRIVQYRALTSILFPFEILENRINHQVVDRPIVFLSELNQPLDGSLPHLLLGDVDRQLVVDLLLRHEPHPLSTARKSISVVCIRCRTNPEHR